MKNTLDQAKLDEFLMNYPVYEYRILDTASVHTEERVRIICERECSRYGSTWACPPAVGSLLECDTKIHTYESAFFFSSVAEVSDIMNMEEMLATREAHEEITSQIGDYFRQEGFDCFILSTESCSICKECAYKKGLPCVHPDRMHPCLESHGVVVSDIVEQEQMEYSLGGNTILWFSMILLRDALKA